MRLIDVEREQGTCVEPVVLDYLGWKQAAGLVRGGLIRTIAEKRVTSDLARQMEGATEVRCSQFAKAIMRNMVTF